MNRRKQTRESNIYQPSFSSNETVNDYFEWLCNIIDVNQADKTYWMLAKTLHKTYFCWTVPNDDNRGEDGLKLRDDFAEEMNRFPLSSFDINDLHDRPCTMLEMLIALAKRMADITAEPHQKDKTFRWFWELMENVGLNKFTDDDYFDMGGTLKINHILGTVLGRTYKRNGEGGLFPIKKTIKDQKKIEIWYQMCEYLNENYYV